MKISFQSLHNSYQAKPDNFENQVKQVMCQNYSKMEKEVVENCKNKVNETYFDEFKLKINQSQNNVGQKDLVNILGTLKNAYLESGLDKDARVLDTQIRNIDVKG